MNRIDDCYVIISDNFEIRVLQNVVYTCVNFYNKSIKEVTTFLENDLCDTLLEVFNLSESDMCFAMRLTEFLSDVKPIIEKYKQ